MWALRSALDISLNSFLHIGQISALLLHSFFLFVTLANMVAKLDCFFLLLTGELSTSFNARFLEVFEESVAGAWDLFSSFPLPSPRFAACTSELDSGTSLSSWLLVSCREGSFSLDCPVLLTTVSGVTLAGLKKFLRVTGGLRARALHLALMGVTGSTRTCFTCPWLGWVTVTPDTETPFCKIGKSQYYSFNSQILIRLVYEIITSHIVT